MCPATEATFRAVWTHASERGWCDGIDGVEYERVWSEWVAAGCPRPVSRFIREAANRPVDSPDWPQAGGGPC